MAVASAAAEAAVKKLARLPANTCCPNCGTQKKFGFSTVCMKYYTFVCNMCKSSHQAISHRCKSLTMSSWTMEEVLLLKTNGNEKARQTWLANAPPFGQGGRPKEGDHLDVFKRFVVETYERKKYFDANGAGNSSQALPATASQVRATASARRAAPQQTSTTQQRAPPPVQAPVAAPPVSAPAPDLLDFGAFESAPAPTPASGGFDPFAPVTAATAATPIAPAPASNPLPSSGGFAGLDPFAAAPVPAASNSLADMKAPTSNGLSGGPINNGLSGGPVNNGLSGAPINNGLSGAPINNGLSGGLMPPMPNMSNPMMMTMNQGMTPNNPAMMMNNQMMMMNTMMMQQPNAMGMPSQPMGGIMNTMGTSNGLNNMSSNGGSPGNAISTSFGNQQPKAKDPFADLGF